jgi:signal transduction histidine kinase
MIALKDGGMSTYYAGLNIVLMGAGIVLRWGLVDSLILLVIALTTYVAACIAHPFIDPAAPPLLSEAVGATFFNNLYFLIVTGVFIATGNYFFSRNRFTEFQLRYQLDQNRAQLEENNSRLRELDEAKSRFFANISHELRTPLTLLLAPLESIRERSAGQWDPRTRDWLDTMHANGMRLLKLINDLLDLVRLESGQLKLRAESFGVPEFVRGLTSAVQKMADDKRVRLVAQLDPVVGSFWGDRDKLEKVFLNLLFNSIKFTPGGGTITFGVQPVAEAGLCFFVQDTGMGIPPDQLKHVFTRFWQADNSAQRKYQGVGIGLALVKELVEAHQGRVEVQSEVGQGTRFTVTLPVMDRGTSPASVGDETPATAGKLAEVPAETVPSPPDEWLSRLYRRAELYPAMTSLQATIRAPADPARGGRPRLLVADDEPDMLRYLKSHLEEEFQVLEAVDGRQAIELAQQYEPEVLVCDMMMPEVDGLEVCRTLRQRPTTQHVPILLLTARADEETKLEALNAGASDFLTKPFSTVELRVRVRNLYESRRLQRELTWQNKKLEATLEQLKETETQLVQSEKLASLGRLSAGIIHEINNPLNYCLLYTSDAADDM